MEFTREFQFLVDCCRCSFEGSALQSSPPALDWARFERLARFHRVEGLVWSAMQSHAHHLPDAVASALSTRARDIVAANLSLAVECQSICTALTARGVRPVFVKGLVVAALAYPAPMLKSAWDVDLLVPQTELLAASEELAGLGYVRVLPPPATDLVEWHVHHKESVWLRSEEGIYVELHSRLIENPTLIPAVGIDSPQRDVEIFRRICLPTLAPEAMFAHLCAHGAISLWYRLKWITDLAGLLNQASSSEIDALYRRSLELGGGRSAAQALLLADHLFGTLKAARDLRDALASNRLNRWLRDQALAQLAGRPDPIEPTAGRFGTLRMHLAQLALVPGVQPKLRALGSKLRALF